MVPGGLSDVMTGEEMGRRRVFPGEVMRFPLNTRGRRTIKRGRARAVTYRGGLFSSVDTRLLHLGVDDLLGLGVVQISFTQLDELLARGTHLGRGTGDRVLFQRHIRGIDRKERCMGKERVV